MINVASKPPRRVHALRWSLCCLHHGIVCRCHSARDSARDDTIRCTHGIQREASHPANVHGGDQNIVRIVSCYSHLAVCRPTPAEHVSYYNSRVVLLECVIGSAARLTQTTAWMLSAGIEAYKLTCWKVCEHARLQLRVVKLSSPGGKFSQISPPQALRERLIDNACP